MTTEATIDQLIDGRLDQISDLVEIIARLHVEIADLTSLNKELRAKTWFEVPDGATNGERDKHADYVSYVPMGDQPAYGAEILRRQGELEAALVQLDALKLLLTHKR